MKPGESVANFWRKKDAGLDDGLLLRLNYFVLHPSPVYEFSENLVKKVKERSHQLDFSASLSSSLKAVRHHVKSLDDVLHKDGNFAANTVVKDAWEEMRSIVEGLIEIKTPRKKKN